MGSRVTTVAFGRPSSCGRMLARRRTHLCCSAGSACHHSQLHSRHKTTSADSLFAALCFALWDFPRPNLPVDLQAACRADVHSHGRCFCIGDAAMVRSLGVCDGRRWAVATISLFSVLVAMADDVSPGTPFGHSKLFLHKANAHNVALGDCLTYSATPLQQQLLLCQSMFCKGLRSYRFCVH